VAALLPYGQALIPRGWGANGDVESGAELYTPPTFNPAGLTAITVSPASPTVAWCILEFHRYRNCERQPTNAGFSRPRRSNGNAAETRHGAGRRWDGDSCDCHKQRGAVSSHHRQLLSWSALEDENQLGAGAQDAGICTPHSVRT
jgi:hypothetical protein